MRGNGRAAAVLTWLATLAVASTTWLAVQGVLSSDATAGILGSVLSLAAAWTVGRTPTMKEGAADGEETQG